MTYGIKKKLIHFYTGGSVAEDFTASRRRKVAALRKIIRTCFYIHCGAGAVCAAAAYFLGAEMMAVPIAVCAGISVLLAFFAAGWNPPLKIILCAADVVFAGAGIIAGVITGENYFTVCGAIMICSALAAAASCIAAFCKTFLESVSPRSLKRGDYTLLRNLSDESASETPTIENLKSGENAIPPLPPLTSEMRELANKMGEILRENGDRSRML